MGILYSADRGGISDPPLLTPEDMAPSPVWYEIRQLVELCMNAYEAELVPAKRPVPNPYLGLSQEEARKKYLAKKDGEAQTLQRPVNDTEFFLPGYKFDVTSEKIDEIIPGVYNQKPVEVNPGKQTMHLDAVGQFASDLTHIVEAKGCPKLHVWRNTSVRIYRSNGLINVDPGVGGSVTIACRGTSTVTDKIIDARYRKASFDEFGGAMIHIGFATTALKIYAKLANCGVLDSIDKTTDRVQLTGHSLGGALSVLLGYLLRRDGYSVGRVVTFGAPMILDQSSAERWNALVPLYRLVNWKDPVPTMPPNILVSLFPIGSGRYNHFGRCLRFSGSLNAFTVLGPNDKNGVEPPLVLDPRTLGLHSIKSGERGYTTSVVNTKNTYDSQPLEESPFEGVDAVVVDNGEDLRDDGPELLSEERKALHDAGYI